MSEDGPVNSQTTAPTLQRRVIATLVGSQVLGGVGVASGIAVMALLARDVSGSEQLAGLGTTFQVLGGALIAVPMARLMAARGRRPGLMLGYLVALVGAGLVIASAVIGSFPLMLAGSLLFGGGTASNSQARYAGADLAEPQHRGRDLSVVVWASTVGSVLGPNLVGPAEGIAQALRLPAMTGSFVIAVVGFGCAGLVLFGLLRPDPLLTARERAGHGAERPHGSVRRGARVVAGDRTASLGLVTIALGHTVMVAVMVMTPLHMDHGGATLRLIGLVISVHILGMYAFSPLTGLAVDRFGGRLVAVVGSAVLVASCLLASAAPSGMSAVLTVALFGLGLGWSCTLVSGSALLTGAVPVAERPGAQGLADLLMGLGAAGGGALAGVVIEHASYRVLSLGAAVLALAVGLAVAVLRPRPPR